jgi:folate-binding protein YgfZ
VLAVWDGEPAMKPDLTFVDPRNAALGMRILVPADLAEKTASLLGAQLVDEPAYEAHRIACGVPRGGIDFAYGDAFPHETNMDRMAGVDFDKGCYIGQEVVSRMQHRGTARTRIVAVTLDGTTPVAGTEIRAADKPIGTMGSSAGNSGLALVRADRATDALDAGAALLAGDITIQLADPEAVRALVAKKHA